MSSKIAAKFADSTSVDADTRQTGCEYIRSNQREKEFSVEMSRGHGGDPSAYHYESVGLSVSLFVHLSFILGRQVAWFVEVRKLRMAGAKL
jgi:hypothetical protein